MSRATIKVEAPGWGSNDSTSLIAESMGRVKAVRVEEEGVLVSVDEQDVSQVRELVKARGLKIIEQLDKDEITTGKRVMSPDGSRKGTIGSANDSGFQVNWDGVGYMPYSHGMIELVSCDE